MIKIYSIISKLEKLFKEFETKGVCTNYKLVLDANNKLTSYMKPLIDENVLDSLRREFPQSAFVNLEDDSYDFMFEDGNGVDIETSRIHLSNLLSEKGSKILKHTPVVTFYSYKGGVGRSTTLASYASHLAIRRKKKVVVFDCDFEAPGFTNFFLEDPEYIYYKNGLVEFFMDSTEGNEDDLSAYYWEASKKFSGQGSVYVFPSGNLSTEVVDENTNITHLKHYLNGLSRLDVFNQDSLTERFQFLISKIESAKPDVIVNTLNGTGNVSFFKQMSEKNYSAKDYMTMSFSIAEEEVATIGAEILKDHMVSWNYYQTTSTAVNEKFVAAYKAKFGAKRVTSDPAEAAYDAVYLWKAACEKAGSFKVEDVLGAIRAGGISFDAPEGKVVINGSNQHLSKPVRVGKVGTDGLIYTVYETPSAVEPDPYLTTYAWAKGLSN